MRERLQLAGLIPGEAQHRRLASGAMDPLIGDLAGPLREMRLQSCKAVEGASGNRVALHVADAALVLALRSGAIRSAGLDLKPPVPGEGMELRVHHDFAAGDVMAQDQRAGIVEQHLLRHTAECREGAFHSLKPVLLALAGERPHVDATGIAERRHEERHQPRCATDLDPSLPEVYLQLLTRSGLEPHRRPGLRPQFLTQMGHRPLDRAQAHLNALLGCKFLTDNICIAGMAPEPFLQPRLQTIQRFRARGRSGPVPSPFLQPPSRRRSRTTKLRRDPAGTPAERLQPQHRRHIVRLLHNVSPQTFGPRKLLSRWNGHPVFPHGSARGPVPRVARGPVCHVA